MTVTENIIMEETSDEELVNVKINKKYLKLFSEICDENELDMEKALNSRVENALVDSFNTYHSKCMRKRRALGFLKGGCGVKRVPGFDTTQIEKVLEKKETNEEKVEWLINYREGLVRTRQGVFAPGLNTVVSNPSNFVGSGVTPYMKMVPQAIEAINKIIRELETEDIVSEKIIHKF